tara:strand:- start:943 stop:1134 length:192 start_codon:yes stop_codon:yes gene_type:complete
VIYLDSNTGEDIVEIKERLNEVIRFLIERPDESWIKADIQDWLRIRNISFTDSETKTQLLEKI